MDQLFCFILLIYSNMFDIAYLINVGSSFLQFINPIFSNINLHAQQTIPITIIDHYQPSKIQPTPLFYTPGS